MVKIYISDHVVTFCDKIPDGTEGELWGVDSAGEISLTKLSQKLQFTKRLFIISPHIDLLFADFLASTRLIPAGGGVTANDRGEILMIHRNGKWDLPKGKLEPGERIEACAVREVEEECGLEGVVRGDFLLHTYHAYQIGDEWALKQTSWFRMRYSGEERPRPQTAEGITFAGWVAPAEIPGKMAESYLTIGDVLRAAGLLR